MADSNSNEEHNGDGNNGLNFGPDILEALLRVSQTNVDTDNLNSVEAISGEYSSVNTTIDELNSFLDRWEERHQRLRADIRDVITEQSQEVETNQQADETQVDESHNDTVDQNSTVHNGTSTSESDKSELDCSGSDSVVVSSNGNNVDDVLKSDVVEKSDKESLLCLSTL